MTFHQLVPHPESTQNLPRPISSHQFPTTNLTAHPHRKKKKTATQPTLSPKRALSTLSFSLAPCGKSLTEIFANSNVLSALCRTFPEGNPFRSRRTHSLVRVLSYRYGPFAAGSETGSQFRFVRSRARLWSKRRRGHATGCGQFFSV